MEQKRIQIEDLNLIISQKTSYINIVKAIEE